MGDGTRRKEDWVSRDGGRTGCGRGFTLLEVMIAMAILAIVLVAVFQSQSQSVSMAGRARFLSTASLLAQERMAEAERTGFDRLLATSGDFGVHYPGYEWKIEVNDTASDNLKRISVTVANSQTGPNHAYSLVYYAPQAVP